MTAYIAAIVGGCALTGAASAQAQTFTAYPTTAAELSQIATGSGIATNQIQQDVVIQTTYFSSIQSLIDAGATVRFDDATATADVYGSHAPEALPSAHFVAESGAAPAVASQIPSGTAMSTCTDAFGLTGEPFCAYSSIGGTGIYQPITWEPGGYVQVCTAGWLLQNSSGFYLSFAGHCADQGTTTFYTQSFRSTPNGTTGSSCPIGPGPVYGDSPWSGYDTAWQYDGGSGGCGDSANIYDAGRNVPQQGAIHAYVGEFVCHDGVASGFSCGTVEQANVGYIETDAGHNYYVTGIDVVCGGTVTPGDSGGPAADETYLGAAVGNVVAGGYGLYPCTSTQYQWADQEIWITLSQSNTWVYTA